MSHVWHRGCSVNGSVSGLCPCQPWGSPGHSRTYEATNPLQGSIKESLRCRGQAPIFLGHQQTLLPKCLLQRAGSWC